MPSFLRALLIAGLGCGALACSSGGSGGGASPGGEPIAPELSGSHGQESITLRYGFVRNIENEASFVGTDLTNSSYVLGAVLSDAPVNCGSNMDTLVESQNGCYIALLFGDPLDGEYSSTELHLKYKSASRSRGLGKSGDTVFCTLTAAEDGSFSATLNVVDASDDPNDVVSFVGQTSLHDCTSSK